MKSQQLLTALVVTLLCNLSWIGGQVSASGCIPAHQNCDSESFDRSCCRNLYCNSGNCISFPYLYVKAKSKREDI